MSTIFSQIVAGQISAYKVAETDQFLAFLDVQPIVEGHTLVIPKSEVDFIFDLSAADYQAIWAFARRVGLAIKGAIPCTKIGISVIGLEVPHAHIHLLPINTLADMDFKAPRLKPTSARMTDLAARIASHI